MDLDCEGEGEGIVKELAERVKRGLLTPEEAKRELLRMGLQHKSYELKYLKKFSLIDYFF